MTFETPPPMLHRINALLHQEPWASMVYGVFWFVILFLVTPLLTLVVLVPLTIYRLLAWKFDWIGAEEYNPKNCGKELAILVTGCDSGFGKEIAFQASNASFVVFAGCLQKESIDYYKEKNSETGTSRIIPILMDVTKDQDVNKAVTRVKEWLTDNNNNRTTQRVLHALVNNAGIAINGCFDWQEVSDYIKVMDVNYFGQLRTCKAILPIFKQQVISGVHNGCRILNITSIAGITPGTATGSAYAASKGAAQAFSEGLRQELSVFGIDVTSINPGIHQTGILDAIETSMTSVFYDKIPPQMREEYGQDYVAEYLKLLKSVWDVICFPTCGVADQVLATLKLRKAPGQVLVGIDAKYMLIFIRLLPSWLLENLLPPLPIPAVLSKNKADQTVSREKTKAQ